MKKNSLRLLALGLLGAASCATAPVHAAGITFDTPPPASVVVLQGGLEWIWAAPCAALGSSCGLPGSPAGVYPVQGFRLPTLDEWASSWASRSALIAAFTDDAGANICGSPWLSSFHSHCDFSDLSNGHIWHASVNGICDPSYFNGCEASTTETFLVRGAQIRVPEPGTLSLLGFGLLFIGLMRRRVTT